MDGVSGHVCEMGLSKHLSDAAVFYTKSPMPSCI
jgi:hypothetical protein